MISTYEIVAGKIHIKTPYCDAIVQQCRAWAGKFDKASSAWILPITRLAEVQKELGAKTDDLVEVRVTKEACDGYQYVRVGWFVLAGRRARDYGADVYADLVAGTIPASGGSMKNPAVNASDDSVFQLWVPRDFAESRNLEIVADPNAGEKAESLVLEGDFTLFDDESVRKKLTVMDKWDAMMDDARNPDVDFSGEMEGFLNLGNTYRIRITAERLSPHAERKKQ